VSFDAARVQIKLNNKKMNTIKEVFAILEKNSIEMDNYKEKGSYADLS